MVYRDQQDCRCEEGPAAWARTETGGDPCARGQASCLDLPLGTPACGTRPLGGDSWKNRSWGQRLLMTIDAVRGCSTVQKDDGNTRRRNLLPLGCRQPCDRVHDHRGSGAAISFPPLTTIHQPKYAVGRAAVEIVTELLTLGTTAPRYRMVEVMLVEPGSVARLRYDKV